MTDAPADLPELITASPSEVAPARARVVARRRPGLTAAGLTTKQERFAMQYVAHGDTPRAYREAFNAKGMKPATVRHKAYLERHRPAVAERIRQLLAEVAAGVTIDARARMAHLQEIVDADAGELVRVAVECCRWCHGADHAYQWTDPAEYAQALHVALAAKRVRPRSSGQVPTDDGGFGFDAHREPHGECPRCGGEGRQVVRVTPTEGLSPAARKLLKSVRQKPSGEIEVRLHNQLDALDMLNRMQGVYVERSVNLTAHVAVPPPKDWTREEQLAFLDSLRPGA